MTTFSKWLESVCLKRVDRLANLAGIKALFGNKRHPGKCVGTTSMIVDNTLSWQFNVAILNTAFPYGDCGYSPAGLRNDAGPADDFVPQARPIETWRSNSKANILIPSD
ncbi:hypothetical protein [Pseudooceanicola nitratireducens]|uniref:hypothetical protein n=1 Tax=Pseudooceanicola nitratireducens TaxID=517719 RepID=UPI0023F091F8|nr:hypothetical protein [Pseudooceanicola nitratireducens]